ncbi:hypothetical protein [Jannaschia donghaensis]|uniref:Uncharacterized protein n=1 Tax=Jannaschia donghaensis TaxID=420998 RepID=A0A0M6YKK2_9RHOB|nr:hypothetical protein [Jannaschia donghaensis]CTQ50892.1 hypothetical protein JDO7802_02923 [Jannaschia donghaensis]
MNNATAAILALLLVSFFGADWLFNDAEIVTFLGKRLIELTEYLAFWR